MAATSDEVEEIVDCVCCTILIHRQVHIKCGECPATLCIQCFRMGAEVGRHKRGHNYELVDTVGQPTFDVRGSWGSMEESKLLIAAHRFKMGNWGEMINLMRSSRSPHEASEYFDRYFIRGPVGQFGLRSTQWNHTRAKMVRDVSIRNLVNTEGDCWEKWHLMLEALHSCEDETLSCEDPNLDEKVSRIVSDHVENLLQADLELAMGSPHLSNGLDYYSNDVSLNSMESRINNRLSEVDSLDPSSDEEYHISTTKKHGSPSLVSSQPSTSGLRISQQNRLHLENDSDSNVEPPRTVPVLVLKKVPLKFVKVEKTPKGSLHVKHSADDEDLADITSYTPLNGRDKQERCGVFAKGKSQKRYRRIVRESSSDEDVEMDTDDLNHKNSSHASSEVDDLHGLEKEHTSETDSSNESEVARSKGTSKTPQSSKSTRKKRKPWKSKKMRRLEAFERRMASKGRKRDEQLNELEEICPKSMIKALRFEQPRLCLDRSRNLEEKPKLRQDDLVLLGYNVDRDEFEVESFNEAETLISRLGISLPTVNNKFTQVENNIKFARIQKFIRTLATRNARRRAIIEHDKIPQFFNFFKEMTLEKRKASQILEDRTPIERVFTRAQQSLTKDELQRLCAHHERSESLRERIRKLRDLQMKGITSLKGFEREPPSSKKKKRNTKVTAENKRKAGLRWKALQRCYQKQYANGE